MIWINAELSGSLLAAFVLERLFWFAPLQRKRTRSPSLWLGLLLFRVPKRTSNAKILTANHKTEPAALCFIIRRRLAIRKARWLYALGRIFANVAPTNLQVYEQRHATEAAVAAFKSIPAPYIGPLAAAG